MMLSIPTRLQPIQITTHSRYNTLTTPWLNITHHPSSHSIIYMENKRQDATRQPSLFSYFKKNEEPSSNFKRHPESQETQGTHSNTSNKPVDNHDDVERRFTEKLVIGEE